MNTLALVAGTVSTVVFAGSMLPMVLKAARSHDLASYSLGNIVLANVGNVVHSVYVFHLPPGPIWALHSFYVVTSLCMLYWYLRYAYRLQQPSPARGHSPIEPPARRPPARPAQVRIEPDSSSGFFSDWHPPSYRREVSTTVEGDQVSTHPQSSAQ